MLSDFFHFVTNNLVQTTCGRQFCDGIFRKFARQRYPLGAGLQIDLKVLKILLIILNNFWRLKNNFNLYWNILNRSFAVIMHADVTRKSFSEINCSLQRKMIFFQKKFQDNIFYSKLCGRTNSSAFGIENFNVDSIGSALKCDKFISLPNKPGIYGAGAKFGFAKRITISWKKLKLVEKTYFQPMKWKFFSPFKVTWCSRAGSVVILVNLCKNVKRNYAQTMRFRSNQNRKRNRKWNSAKQFAFGWTKSKTEKKIAPKLTKNCSKKFS